jgi:hypothetical protein
MNTNRASTLGTSPFYVFILQKFSNTEIPNISKVFDHAHIVFGSISFIQMFQVLAREIITSKTILCFTFLKNSAIFDFTSSNGNGFIGICCPATGAFIFLSQISHANATVHATGSNK